MGRGGVEPPTRGFSFRCPENTTSDKTKTYENPKTKLTHQLTPNPQDGLRQIQKSHQKTTKDDQQLPEDLAEIVSAWPNLPETIKAEIKALVQNECQNPQSVCQSPEPARLSVLV
jgi:hypothetical protein